MRAQRTWTGEVPIHSWATGNLVDTRHFEVMPRIGDTILVANEALEVIAVVHSNEHFSRAVVWVQ